MAKTINDIQTLDDLRGTIWLLNEQFTGSSFEIKLKATEGINIGAFIYNAAREKIYGDGFGSSDNSAILITRSTAYGVTLWNGSEAKMIYYYLYGSGGFSSPYNVPPQSIEFYDWIAGQVTETSTNKDFLTWLKENATIVKGLETPDDLRKTAWKLNENINLRDITQNHYLYAVNYEDTEHIYGTYQFDDQIINICSRGIDVDSRLVELKYTYNGITSTPKYGTTLIIQSKDHSYFALYDATYYGTSTTQWSERWLGENNIRGNEPRLLKFNDWEDGTVEQYGDIITWLKENATQVEYEEPTGTIVRVNGKVLNQVNGKKVRAIHYGDKTWVL